MSTTPEVSSHFAFAELKTPCDDFALEPRLTDASDVCPTPASRAKSDAGPFAKDEPPRSYRVTKLFRFASALDLLLLSAGVVMAALKGAMLPIVGLLFGDIFNAFAVIPIDLAAVNRAARSYLVVAAVTFVAEYVTHVALYHSAERQVTRLRDAVLRRAVHLDIAWYDANDAAQLATRLAGDTVRIKAGMGEELGELFEGAAALAVGLSIALAKGWDIALATASVLPLMAAIAALLFVKLSAKAEQAQQLYAEAGAVAEETIRNTRTVAALSSQPRALVSYERKARAAEELVLGFAKFEALAFAVFVGCIYVTATIGLWYGGWKVSRGGTDPGAVVTAFMAFLTGAMGLGNLMVSVSALATATGAAQALFTVLDTPSQIDTSCSAGDGVVPSACNGAVEFVDVVFAYPSRPDAPVLNGVRASIASGETVAVVGPSGGGKSTLVALLERFYDPTGGAVLLDGHDVRSLSVPWLRAQIGLVSQEPVLFAVSIFDNIVAGGCCVGAARVTREQVVRAAQRAHAHEFILRLPGQYDAVVGQQGVLLSGGQKQRLAIARAILRAILRAPKLLVLDEATSALDSESERAVQAALNALLASSRATALVIAHRLSTIRSADRILVLEGGRVVESGPHHELLQIEGGVYRSMCEVQQLSAVSVEEEEGEGAGLSGGDTDDGGADIVSTQLSEGVVETNDVEPTPFGLQDVVRLAIPERKNVAFGAFASVVLGLMSPALAVVMSATLASIALEYGNFLSTGNRGHLDALYDDCAAYGLLFLGGACAVAAVQWVQSYNFRLVFIKLVTRLSTANFAALCRQNVGFFDAKERGAGALVADLAVDRGKVAGLVGLGVPHMLEASFAGVAMVVVSFAAGSWQLTLAVLAVVPVLGLAQVLRYRLLKTRNAVEDELAPAGSHASEVLTNIRTVVALGIEDAAATKYALLLAAPRAQGQAAAQINGLAAGFSGFVVSAAQALVVWYGAKLVVGGGTTFERMLRTETVILMSLANFMSVSSTLGSAVAAYKAGSRIFSLVARPVAIDSFSAEGRKLDHATVQGKIEFRGVEFRYPARPEVSALRNFDLTIEAGETVAFCGPSGGKSTIVALVERFYDPVRGHVLFDGVCLRELNVRSLRAQIGLVSQEPTLFIGTIAENIALGSVQSGDTSLDATRPTQEQIEAAARLANAHDFIQQLPDGYATQVGSKGEQLSGGQEQRIAIARAVLKDPAVLILDEATSALDAENEKLVQDALDKVLALQSGRRRRTTLVIAHRLSTIQNADRICVVRNGAIVEQGPHSALLRAGGMYARLVASASGDAKPSA